MPKTVYDHPRLYDLAFSYRDYDRELAAIEDWFYSHTSKKTRLDSVLELASGPARHAIAFGKKGKLVAALDSSPSMCKYARSIAKEEKVDLLVVQEDMRSFRLNQQFSLVLNMIDSISHITSKTDLIRHLKTVSKHLKDGGIYVLELSKIEEEGDEANTKGEWDIKKDDVDLHIQWDSTSSRKGKSHLVNVRMRDRNKVAPPVNDSMYLRQWTKDEIDDALERADCFDVRAIYGAFSKLKWNSKKAWRLIYILRKSKH